MNALADLKLSELWPALLQWLDKTLIDQQILAQSVLILACLVIAALISSVIRKPIINAIDASKMPIRIKRIINNLRKLIWTITALILLFIVSQIVVLEPLALKISFVSAMMKVLLAWILIRISLQFVENPFVRNVFAVMIWVVAALSIFGVLDETTQTLDNFALTIGEFRVSALAIIKAILSIVILLYLALFFSTFAERQVLRIQGLKRSSQVLIAKVVRVTLVVFALLIGVTMAGIDLSLFAVFGGAVGLGIGFGLQKGISNLFSGMLLLMDQSIKPGDVLELENEIFGWVNKMGARYTEIITRDNKSYLIPNEDFITQRVVNWSHGDSLIRLEVKFGVHYESDTHHVIKICKEAAKRPERVVAEPSPVCWLIEFGDSSLNFTLRFWIKDAEEGVTNVRGEVMIAIWDALQEHNVAIPYPHREVFIHKSPDNQAA